MGKKFNLSNIRVKDCITVLDVVGREPSKALEAMGDVEQNPRSLRHLHNLADELEAGIKDYVELREKATGEVSEFAKPFQVELDKALEECTTEESFTMKDKEISRRASKAMAAADKEVAEKYNIAEEHDKVATIEIQSNERFDVLKSVIEKRGLDTFKDSKALVEILDALDAAESL